MAELSRQEKRADPLPFDAISEFRHSVEKLVIRHSPVRIIMEFKGDCGDEAPHFRRRLFDHFVFGALDIDLEQADSLFEFSYNLCERPNRDLRPTVALAKKR